MKDMADGTPRAKTLQKDIQRIAVYTAQLYPVILPTDPQVQAHR